MIPPPRPPSGGPIRYCGYIASEHIKVGGAVIAGAVIAKFNFVLGVTNNLGRPLALSFNKSAFLLLNRVNM